MENTYLGKHHFQESHKMMVKVNCVPQVSQKEYSSSVGNDQSDGEPESDM